MGTKLEIWKQGQFYPELGKKIIELPYQVNPGPSDQQVKIEGFNVQTDKNGNFLHGNYSEDELDAIHTYGVVRMVIDLYEWILKKPIIWSWQQKGIQKPLSVEIRKNGIEARYLKEYQTIELDYYGHPSNLIYNCRTVDLVAHETGHAVIDSMKPEWDQGNAETRGMAETFCDLTTMFLVLSQYDLCQEVIKETNGDLRKDSIISLFGVGHGFRNKTKREIRSVHNNAKYKSDDWNPYSFCEVLTTRLYRFLVDFFKLNKILYPDTAEALFHSAEKWMKRITYIYLKCGSEKSSISEFLYLFQKSNSLNREE